jgi:putative transposase
VGPNPTDRAKNGVKRSLLIEAEGGPHAAVVAEANVHDTKLLAATLEAVVERPEPHKVPQHLCLDKGYDNPTGEEVVADHGYVPHIRRIGEEKLDKTDEKRYPPRRWVVERTLGFRSAGQSSFATTRKLRRDDQTGLRSALVSSSTPPGAVVSSPVN